MGRRYRGQPPADGVLLAETCAWQLWLRPGQSSWCAVKLTAKSPQPKANYALAWSPIEQRFARHRESVLLAAHWPQMAQWAEAQLRAAGDLL